ncbi:MAG: hypothetical protein HY832_01600 [Candidatus Aenigmarchaeota archaeon]|nr:hypothetical protein [Candidatus Aenigmarchaeota archaeon]
MRSPVLPKIVGWILLAGLILLDAFLDVIFAQGRGLENFLWKPIASFLGVTNPLLLTLLVLLIFFVCVKVSAFLTEKFDHTPKAEELVLTIFILVYGIFDVWLISVYLFDFRVITNHFQLIPLLIIIGIVYGWWAENILRKKK